LYVIKIYPYFAGINRKPLAAC